MKSLYLDGDLFSTNNLLLVISLYFKQEFKYIIVFDFDYFYDFDCYFEAFLSLLARFFAQGNP